MVRCFIDGVCDWGGALFLFVESHFPSLLAFHCGRTVMLRFNVEVHTIKVCVRIVKFPISVAEPPQVVGVHNSRWRTRIDSNCIRKYIKIGTLCEQADTYSFLCWSRGSAKRIFSQLKTRSKWTSRTVWRGFVVHSPAVTSVHTFR